MSAVSPNQENLIRSAIAGDRAALESLLLHFHDPLLAELRSLLRRSTASVAAEDVLQETFIEVFRRIRSIDHRGASAFYSWLKTIARTRLLNQIKANRAQKRGGDRRALQHMPVDGITVTTILGQLAGPDKTASVIARRKEAVSALADALAQLDPLRRQAVEMRYVQGLSIEQIADKTGKTEGAIKMLLNRSIKDLRQAIATSGGEISIGA